MPNTWQTLSEKLFLSTTNESHVWWLCKVRSWNSFLCCAMPSICDPSSAWHRLSVIANKEVPPLPLCPTREATTLSKHWYSVLLLPSSLLPGFLELKWVLKPRIIDPFVLSPLNCHGGNATPCDPGLQWKEPSIIVKKALLLCLCRSVVDKHQRGI